MKAIYFLILVYSLSLLFFLGSTKNNLPLYKNSSLPIDERVEDLLKQLTLEEKIDMLGGIGFEFEILFGSSSRDLKLKERFVLQ